MVVERVACLEQIPIDSKGQHDAMKSYLDALGTSATVRHQEFKNQLRQLRGEKVSFVHFDDMETVLEDQVLNIDDIQTIITNLLSRPSPTRCSR